MADMGELEFFTHVPDQEVLLAGLIIQVLKKSADAEAYAVGLLFRSERNPPFLRVS